MGKYFLCDFRRFHMFTWGCHRVMPAHHLTIVGNKEYITSIGTKLGERTPKSGAIMKSASV
jgi:hypothetical protein